MMVETSVPPDIVIPPNFAIPDLELVRNKLLHSALYDIRSYLKLSLRDLIANIDAYEDQIVAIHSKQGALYQIFSTEGASDSFRAKLLPGFALEEWTDEDISLVKDRIVSFREIVDLFSVDQNSDRETYLYFFRPWTDWHRPAVVHDFIREIKEENFPPGQFKKLLSRFYPPEDRWKRPDIWPEEERPAVLNNASSTKKMPENGDIIDFY
jgi:hypothetical protein